MSEEHSIVMRRHVVDWNHQRALNFFSCDLIKLMMAWHKEKKIEFCFTWYISIKSAYWCPPLKPIHIHDPVLAGYVY